MLFQHWKYKFNNLKKAFPYFLNTLKIESTTEFDMSLHLNLLYAVTYLDIADVLRWFAQLQPFMIKIKNLVSCY